MIRHPIINAGQFFRRGRRGSAEHLPPAERAFFLFPPALYESGAIELPRLGELDESVVGRAYVNHGRWLVDCPFGCGSAQVADPADQRFLCAGSDGCGNAALGGAHVAVEYPSDLELVEELLARRPLVSNIHTTKTTPADDVLVEVAAENDAQNIELPADLRDAVIAALARRRT